jgi:hypothetical protein
MFRKTIKSEERFEPDGSKNAICPDCPIDENSGESKICYIIPRSGMIVDVCEHYIIEFKPGGNGTMREICTK